MTEPQPKRTYRSTHRREQARQTQQKIIESARALFLSRGYALTTIEAIASEAGVSPETVYSTFGNKLSLLSKLIDVSIVEDEEPDLLLERPMIQSARAITDQHKLIQKFVRDISGIMTRMSPIFLLLRSTEKTDPEIAALLQRLLKGRLAGMAFFVEQLTRIGHLRAGLDSRQAAETAWALSSGEVFHLLTVDLQWSHDRYIQWLTGSLERILLP